MTTYLVTGGAGFIGSNLAHRLHGMRDARVVVLDLLTYAGNLENLADLEPSPRFSFVQGDIGDRPLLRRVLQEHAPDMIFNLAAESHVDRSIDSPRAFVLTNVLGTFELLDAALDHWSTLRGARRDSFRFLHVSTDEVYGSLGAQGRFSESTPYAPNSPYAATKAGADHLVRAYHRTFGLPAITTNCSNNFGPYQFPEKLIPLIILHALAGQPLPVYGDGSNVRDWLYVEDHCEGLLKAAERGLPGETYVLGGYGERDNLQVVEAICVTLDKLAPPRDRLGPGGPTSYRELITFVSDRPGHDHRYAIDPSKIQRELGWKPKTKFEDGLRETIRWYLAHDAWCARIQQRTYQGQRLGLTRR